MTPDERVLRFLRANRGSWFTPAQVELALLAKGRVDFSVAGRLMSLRHRGTIEHDHQGRMVLYRLPPATPRRRRSS